MFCPRCQTEIQDDMSFCPQCGMKINKCPHCHQPVVPGASYCAYCGSELEKAPQSRLDGYYQPLDDTYQKTQQTSYTSIHDVPVNKHVNKPLIMIITMVVALLMAGSYIYIYHGPQMTYKQEETELKKEEIEVSTSTKNPSIIGNTNQGGFVYQSQDKIYMCDDNGYIVSMDKKFENRQTLVREKCENIIVVENVIYYTNENHAICQISIDGKDQKVLLNQAVYYLNYKDHKLYYQLDEEGKENIYVYDLKTNQQTQLNDRQSYCLNILDDCIYYTSHDGIYKMGLDGKGEEKILEGDVNSLIYHDGKLYYTLQYRIMSYDLKTQKSETVIEEMGLLLNMTDTDIFYYSRKNDVKRYHMETKESTTVYSGNIKFLSVVGDKLLIETLDNFNKTSYKVIMEVNGDHQQRLFISQKGDFV